MNHADDADRVDWLDLGPDPDEGRPPRDPRRNYLWYGAAVVAVVLALVLTRTQHGTNRAATSTGSPPRTAVPSSPSAPASSVAPTESGSFGSPSAAPAFPSGSPVRVRSVGHRLLDVPADWELFALGPGLVLRIQLALGRVTSTAVPGMNNEVQTVFFVGADRAMVHPLDGTFGSVVRDDKPAALLPTPFLQGLSLLPGPDQRHLWAEQGNGLTLFTLDGRPTTTRIEVPPTGAVLGSDNFGYALLTGIGGTYAARPGVVHRVTSGQLLASGPTRWLAIECDDSLSCEVVVTERSSGARHSLNTPIDYFNANISTISPDGRTVALPRVDGVSSAGIHLLDLDSGVDRSVEVNPNTANAAGPSFVWSPDSRWLFAVDAGGRVMVVNRATGKVAPLDVGLPPVAQLALRHGDG